MQKFNNTWSVKPPFWLIFTSDLSESLTILLQVCVLFHHVDFYLYSDLSEDPPDLIISALNSPTDTSMPKQPWHKSIVSWVTANKSSVLSIDPSPATASEASGPLSLVCHFLTRTPTLACCIYAMLVFLVGYSTPSVCSIPPHSKTSLWCDFTIVNWLRAVVQSCIVNLMYQCFVRTFQVIYLFYQNSAQYLLRYFLWKKERALCFHFEPKGCQRHMKISPF